MPYDLPFSRVVEVDNESSLKLNKIIAAKLIAAFPEVYDMNLAGSSRYFLNLEVADLDEDFPDMHFRLWAEIEDISFDFAFWKDTIWIELGSYGNTYLRFIYLQKYAAFLTQQGFIIDVDSDSKAVTLDERIAWHLKEYKEWAGYVDHVRETLNNDPSSTIG
ncbi:hypothetical protein FY528_06440 [Hymenobacter lutimineralis]|uniref:Uncharacterized protein n=1 Tax=Hymenobacter lutimineralis TaxID=2606448 RepID=A0A5D6V9Z8_9BACT|nr:hypothetical protein [Hymenobacter lutimineralis]TYZ11982.1 hypothetical protein FY528_06440 [Hymenobacter lutimineralis]